MSDEKLMAAFAGVDADHSLYRAFVELMDRMERRMVDEVGNPNEAKDQRMEALTAVWTLREYRRTVEEWRLAARKKAA